MSEDWEGVALQQVTDSLYYLEHVKYDMDFGLIFRVSKYVVR